MRFVAPASRSHGGLSRWRGVRAKRQRPRPFSPASVSVPLSIARSNIRAPARPREENPHPRGICNSPYPRITPPRLSRRDAPCVISREPLRRARRSRAPRSHLQAPVPRASEDAPHPAFARLRRGRRLRAATSGWPTKTAATAGAQQLKTTAEDSRSPGSCGSVRGTLDLESFLERNKRRSCGADERSLPPSWGSARSMSQSLTVTV
jgi:hypothetical protein